MSSRSSSWAYILKRDLNDDFAKLSSVLVDDRSASGVDAALTSRCPSAASRISGSAAGREEGDRLSLIRRHIAPAHGHDDAVLYLSWDMYSTLDGA